MKAHAIALLFTCVQLAACLDSAIGSLADASADADAAAPAPTDPFVEVRVGATGWCARTESGRVTCSPGPGASFDSAPFVVVEAGALELAAAGTVIWHLELMACAVVATPGAEIVCSNGSARYTLALSGAHALALGDFTACALDGDDQSWCWSPLDLATASDGAILERGPTLPDVVALAASAYGMCALNQAGAVSCWGTPRAPDEPIQVRLPQPARTLCAGVGHTCALLASGEAACWGADNVVDAVATFAPPEGAIAALAVGGWSTCIIEQVTGWVRCRSGDTTRAWALGELAQFDVGESGVCGLSDDGTIVCADLRE